MRRFLLIGGYILLAPVWVGTMGKIAVDAYRGEADFFLWTGLALLCAVWAWDYVKKRREPPAPRKFTIYDWTEEPDGVRFHARYDDGEEIEFVHTRGMTGTKTEASA